MDIARVQTQRALRWYHLVFWATKSFLPSYIYYMLVRFLDPDTARRRLSRLTIMTSMPTHHCDGSIIKVTYEQRQRLTTIIRNINHSHIRLVDIVMFAPGVYGDAPFTWGKSTIILTPRVLNRSDHELTNILFHEMVHLDQRRRPGLYRQLYHTLGFSKTSVDIFGPYRDRMLDNPDGNDYCWIWTDPITGRQYAPYALRDSHDTLLMDIATGRALPAKLVSEFWRQFGQYRQTYHPNEIAACMLTLTRQTHKNL